MFTALCCIPHLEQKDNGIPALGRRVYIEIAMFLYYCRHHPWVLPFTVLLKTKAQGIVSIFLQGWGRPIFITWLFIIIINNKIIFKLPPCWGLRVCFCRLHWHPVTCGAIMWMRSRLQSAARCPGLSGAPWCDAWAEEGGPVGQEAPARQCNPASSPALHGRQNQGI